MCQLDTGTKKNEIEKYKLLKSKLPDLAFFIKLNIICSSFNLNALLL